MNIKLVLIGFFFIILGTFLMFVGLALRMEEMKVVSVGIDFVEGVNATSEIPNSPNVFEVVRSLI